MLGLLLHNLNLSVALGLDFIELVQDVYKGQEETLAMKLRVHEDIGHSILATRRVLLQNTDQKEIRAAAAL